MKRRAQIALIYGASLVASIGAFLLIRNLGHSLVAAGTVEPQRPVPTGPSAGGSPLMHVLIALAVVIVLTRILGLIFRKFNQPRVMGEVIAGILLGPSFLGWLAPWATSQVFPVTVAPYLTAISQIGIVLYMFLVGVELDTNLLRQRTQASIAISHASIVVPFLMGGALALWLYPLYATRGVSFTSFALFLGVAMSITAFPVLARILTDRGMHTSRTGVLALGCAAVDDVTAWCLLGFVVAVARADARNPLLMLAMTVAFILFVLLIAKRGALWLVRKRAEEGRTTRDIFAMVCAAVLLAALITEWIGIHALFGAFLLGTLIPHNSMLARDIRDKSEDIVLVLLLPMFFAFTGMRTQIGLITETRDWLACVVIMVVASFGKFGGSFLAARLTGSDWREAASLGVLMNTRGLMELIVLNVGLDLGVLSPALFSMFVMMAILTTLATTPILQVLTPSRTAAVAVNL